MYLSGVTYTMRHHVLLFQGNAAWVSLHTVIIEKHVKLLSLESHLQNAALLNPVKLQCGLTVLMFAS